MLLMFFIPVFVLALFIVRLSSLNMLKKSFRDWAELIKNLLLWFLLMRWLMLCKLVKLFKNQEFSLINGLGLSQAFIKMILLLLSWFMVRKKHLSGWFQEFLKVCMMIQNKIFIILEDRKRVQDLFVFLNSYLIPK